MKLYKSKILIVSLLLISLAFGNVSGASTASADDEYGIMLISANPNSQTLGEKIVETALYLEELHPSRGSGTADEAAAAETLAEMLEAYGFGKIYASYTDVFLYTPLTDTSGTTTVTDQRKTSQNVIGYINNNKEQTIIIGAHYDNYAFDGEEGSTGMYCNLLGVSTALEVAYQLSLQEDFEYNIMLAFWGAEEDGLHGSQYFVSTLTSTELDAIALYVNFDILGVGDNLYIFTNEIADYHEEIFLEEAVSLGYDLSGAPEDKQYTYPMFSERPFMHMGISSDNFYFTTSGVMCANFLSCVWDDGYIVESTGKTDILYTANDNSTYIFETYSREVIEERMTEVSEIVISTLTRDDIVSVLATSKEQSNMVEYFYDDSFSTIVCIVLVLIFAFVLFFFWKKIGKEVKLPEDEEPGYIPAKIENIEIFGETVVLEDGALRRGSQANNSEQAPKDNTPPSPFEF